MRYSLDPPIPIAKPTRCGWCANLLCTCRNILKVKDCERYYCSQVCFLQGEERGLRYRAALAGHVHSPWYVGLAAILAVFMLAFTFTGGSKAWAQDTDGTVHQVHPGHAQHHDIYKGWTQANGWSSCCNGDDPETGKKGDCRPARAYPDEHGQWHVLIRGRYVPVPKHAIRDYQPPDGNSHVCEDENNGIMCFIKGKPKA